MPTLTRETATSTVLGGGGLSSDFWLGLAVGLLAGALAALVVLLVQRRRRGTPTY